MTALQVDCFLAVLEHGNIAAAAKALFLSPQVVSQHISQLEKELTVRLFFRGRTSAALTEQGQEFYDFAIRWIGLYNHTIRSIREDYANLPLHFFIGLSDYIDAVGAISSGIADFAHEHDSTEITCVQQDNQSLMDGIFSGKLDVALVCGSQIVPQAELGIDPIAQEDLRLYISGVEYLPPGLQSDSPELQEVFLSRPHVNTPYGVWSAQGWSEVSRRMNSFLGVSPHSFYSVPNFRSVLACIQTTPCTVVSDARFGYLHQEDNIYNIPLHADSYLSCIFLKTNENPLVQEFINHLKWYYAENQ